MKKADPRLMLIMSKTDFGTKRNFVRNIPVAAGGLALYRAGLAALLGTEQPVVSLFGKADIRQVTEVLRVTPQENLRMIRECVA